MDTQVASKSLVPSYTNLSEFANYFLAKGVTQQQISFLVLCEKKNALFKILQEKELEAQQVLLKEYGDIKHLEDALALYRSIYEEMSNKIRLPYTNYLRDNLANPAMEFEKRVDPKTNSDYIKLID